MSDTATKIYILVESGGEYEDIYYQNILSSFDKEKLEKMAEEHNNKQKKRRLRNKIYREVEELEIL